MIDYRILLDVLIKKLNTLIIMEPKELYLQIKRIAEEQVKENETMNRSDLAYELRNYGLNGDSFDLNKLVFEAYSFYDNSDAIRDVFVNTESNDSIVLSYLLYNTLDKGNHNEVKTMMESTLSKTETSLSVLREQVNENLSERIIDVSASVVNVISGNSAVVKIQKKAGVLFGGYTDMVNCYETAKMEIKGLTKDFVYLRNDIMSIYRDYSTALIDIFGDSIKSIEPELFDFERIEWIDVKGMLDNTQLEYSKLSESCSSLMNEISGDFKNMLQNSVNTYKAVNNKGVGLVLVGLNCLNHYTNARAKAANLGVELQTFKNNIRKDGMYIKTDMVRLMSIYKSMNDVNIPKANAFYRFSEKVLSKELEMLINSLYGTENLKQLKEKRDKIFSTYKSLETLVTDHQSNIDNYQVIIEDNELQIANLKDDYNEAMNLKPSKPSFIIIFLTFGYKNKTFNRETYEWQQQYSEVIKRYQNLQVDVKLYKDDLVYHQTALKEAEKNYCELRIKLDKVNTEIRKELLVSSEVKGKVVNSLKDIVGLLRLAREIANTKLQDKMFKVIKPVELKEIIIPDNVQNGISSFVSMFEASMSGSIHDGANLTSNILKDMEERKNQRIQKAIDEGVDEKRVAVMKAESMALSETDICDIEEGSLQAVVGLSNLFEAQANLIALRKESNIALEQYNEKMTTLQEEFKSIINKVDDKSVILRETMKRINTSKDLKELKSALLSLSDGDIELSEIDINDFFNNNKTIEL